jgi:hypothetical protein
MGWVLFLFVFIPNLETPANQAKPEAPKAALASSVR